MRLAVVPGLLALLLTGCTTMSLAGAEVWMAEPLDGVCLADLMKAEKDVINFRRIPERKKPTWQFQLQDPDLVGTNLPNLSLSQDVAGGEIVVDLESNFSAMRFRGAPLRRALVQRQQEMLGRVVEACSGRSVEFDAPRLCGKGEGHSLCAVGRLRPA